MKMPFTVSWEQITPEIAREWLGHNTKNRRLRKPTVVSYARDMRMGEWLPNHQGIAFDAAGNLIDGQHRLAAIVAAAVTLYMLVARGVPTQVNGARSTTMDTIDRGAARSVADMLQLSHGTVDANAVTAVCALLAAFAINVPGRVTKITLAQSLAVIDLWRSSITFAVQNRAKQTGLRSAPVMTAIAFAHAVEPKMVEKFYLSLVSGEGLFKETPIFTLRNFLMEEPGHRERGERFKIMEMILTAIGCHRHNEKMSRVQINKDHVEAFRAPQAVAVARLEEIFPKSCEGSIQEVKSLAKAPRLETSAVITSHNWKPTAFAEDILRGKAMAERIGKNVGGGAFICPVTGKPKKLRARNSASKLNA